MIKISLENNTPKCKIGKNITKACNNVGGFQGIPISAQLFIIYDDHIMNKYTNDIRNSNIIGNNVIIKIMTLMENGVITSLTV